MSVAKLRNRWVIFAHDVLWVPVAITVAYWIRFNLGSVPQGLLNEYFLFMAVATPAHAISFWLFGCYRGIWRFASIPDLIRITWAVGLGLLATVLALFLVNRLAEIPRSAIVLYPMLLVAAVAGARVAYRAIRDHGVRPALDTRKRALILGAGSAGEALVRELLRQGPFFPAGVLDDDPLKLGQEVHGVRVWGPISDLPRRVHALDIDMVLIAMPSADRDAMNRIVKLCSDAEVEFRTLPTVKALAESQAAVSQLREVTVEDLLGREPILLDNDSIGDFVANRSIMVTGGGGSIGSELCRQVAEYKPALLVIVDNSEFNLFRVELELLARFPGVPLRAVIGDVRDTVLMDRLFARHQPAVVFHAAAYKHVPILEENPCQGVLNNVIGTRIVADAAARHGAERFVLISTDKTVNPTSVMGATKRVAELYCQNLGRNNKTQFVTTRFGNVLGSCGSAIPLFEEQIRTGGPVTVTDPEVTRFFMTVEEAVGLILQASVIGKGGDILVMDMGMPVKISELAEKMIHLSGKTPGRDIEIVYTGLRPGEKLHEELFYEKEQLVPTRHRKLLQASSFPVDWAWLSAGIDELAALASSGNSFATVEQLQQLVPEFSTHLKDWASRTQPPHLRLIQ